MDRREVQKPPPSSRSLLAAGTVGGRDRTAPAEGDPARKRSLETGPDLERDNTRTAGGRPTIGRSIGRIGPVEIIVRMIVRPGGDALPYVHDFISKYARDRYRSAVAASVGLAAFELVSNGIAYGSGSADVTLELLEQGRDVLVRVSNAAIPARIRRLRELIEKLSHDPQATYNEQLERSLITPGRALLGLARVAHEANMRLEIGDSQDGLVVVTAVCNR